MLTPVLGAIGCGRVGAGLARPTLPRSFFESSPEVLEEALQLGMLVGDAGPIHPPEAVAAMSLSTLSRVIDRVQISRRRRRRSRKGMGATSLNRRINSPHRPASREEDAEADNKERVWVLTLTANTSAARNFVHNLMPPLRKAGTSLAYFYYTCDICGKYSSGERLSSEHEKAILKRLLTYHPQYGNKIGCGIASITILAWKFTGFCRFSPGSLRRCA